MEKVVVTGLGAITPIGNDIDSFWDSLKNGKSGIAPITSFDTEGFKAKLGAEVKGFVPEEYIEKKEARRMDRYCQLAIAAAKQAVADSGLDLSSIDPFRCGVITGSGIGGMQTFETESEKIVTRGPGRVSPLFIPMMITNMAAGNIAMEFGFKGANYTAVTACSSSTHAIGDAFRLIKHGYLDIAVAGGSEAAVTRLAVAGFTNMTALATTNDVDAASLPFDKRRNGFVIGEGSGMLVLESETSAKKRGAKIYGEIAGFGATADAYHITSPSPEGDAAARAMEDAYTEAGLNACDVDYINAHGTGTPLNDKFETTAIKRAFGEHAYKMNISSSKSMTGHLLGGAGAVEAIVGLLSIKYGIVTPTINLLDPDEECDLNYTPNTAVEREINAVISNSLGFGGHNGSLLIKKY